MASNESGNLDAISDDLDQIEIDEDITVDEVRESDGTLVATVIDDLVVTSAPEGSLVDETIDIVDLEGHLILEDEIITVYDADARVISREETIAIPLEEPTP